VQTVVAAAGGLISGYISDRLAPHQIFYLMAALAVLIACMGFWKPRSVFAHTYDQPQARGSNFVGDVRRLLHHRAIYPAILINCLWNFAPGAATPLQFYLSNELHASDAIFSYYNGIFAAAFIPTMLLYGFLCKRVPLNRLLWWGTIIAVPQMIPLLFIHSPHLALVLAVPEGLMGGIATVAYTDLAMRSCPPGLQGTLMMLVDGAFWLSSRGGDVVGTWIYGSSATHGFFYCVIAITVTYLAILPLILLVPKDLIATADAQPSA
jgi:Na+/melibiose symporter-like transporter